MDQEYMTTVVRVLADKIEMLEFTIQRLRDELGKANKEIAELNRKTKKDGE